MVSSRCCVMKLEWSTRWRRWRRLRLQRWQRQWCPSRPPLLLAILKKILQLISNKNTVFYLLKRSAVICESRHRAGVGWLRLERRAKLRSQQQHFTALFVLQFQPVFFYYIYIHKYSHNIEICGFSFIFMHICNASYIKSCTVKQTWLIIGKGFLYAAANECCNRTKFSEKIFCLKLLFLFYHLNRNKSVKMNLMCKIIMFFCYWRCLLQLLEVLTVLSS